jgi:hypothetical protein
MGQRRALPPYTRAPVTNALAVEPLNEALLNRLMAIPTFTNQPAP